MKYSQRLKINKKMSEGDESCHHPEKKKNFFLKTYDEDFLDTRSSFKPSCYEYFEGTENSQYCTSFYNEANIQTEGNDIVTSGIDSYLLHHKHISEKRKYDIIDLDCFGLPFKFFPQIYMLLNDKAFLYVTSVNYYTPILNWRRKMQFQSYFKKNKPTYKDYSDFIIDSGKAYLFDVKHIGTEELNKRIVRMAFKCEYLKNRNNSNINKQISITDYGDQL
jgi:hypothetical protein